MQATLCKKQPITERDTLYRLECEGIASVCEPGQFVELRIGDGLEPFFRRPISIFDANGSYIDLLVRTAGKGTRLMTGWREGCTVDILGPLGQGFSYTEQESRFLLVGGGIGAAPLHFLAKRLGAASEVIFLFSPTRDKALLDAFSPEVSASVSWIDSRAVAADRLRESIAHCNPDRVFCCGPEPFMQTVASVCVACDVPLQVSMESHMACGVGICLGCVIPVRDGEDIRYRKVCHDGPVFDGKDVVFHG